jgi:hypothetical protein
MLLSGSGRFDHVRSDAQAAAQFTGFSRLMSTLLIVMTLANAVATFALCGPVECPDSPIDYWIGRFLPVFMR